MRRCLRGECLLVLVPVAVFGGLGLLWSLSPAWWFAVVIVTVVVSFALGHVAGERWRARVGEGG